MPTSSSTSKTAPTSLPSVVEFKTFHFELKSVDEVQGIVCGYLSTFGNMDRQDDIVHKGAFLKTIAERTSAATKRGKKALLPMLWMHDPERPIGYYYLLREDEHGLYVEAQLDITTNEKGIPNNPLAVMVFSGYKIGYIDEQSIGYEPIKKDIDDKTGARNLREVRLWEGSAVTMLFAANPEAVSTGIKDTSRPGRASTTDSADSPTVQRMPTPHPPHSPRSSSTVSRKDTQTTMHLLSSKDFNDHYREQCIADWLYTDFNNLVVALKQSCMDIFAIGDEPQSDVVDTILNDGDDSAGFITALKNWVQKGIDLNVSNYLNVSNTSDNIRYYLSDKKPGLQAKAGRSISAANASKITDAATSVQDAVTAHKAMTDMHVKAMNDLASQMSSSNPEQCKALQSLATQHQAMANMHQKALTTTAEDLSAILGSPAYSGDDQAAEQTAADTGKFEPRSHALNKSNGSHASTNAFHASNGSNASQPDTSTEEGQLAAWLQGQMATRRTVGH